MLSNLRLRWWNLGSFLAVVVVGALSLVAARADEPPAASKRLPVPASAEREKGLAAVHELFKADVDKARNPEELTALCNTLCQTAEETKNDPAGRFALWQMALEVATKAGDLNAALAAIEALARNYEVDEIALKATAFGNLSPRLTAKNFRDGLILGTGVLAQAVAADRFELAKTLNAATSAVVRKYGDAALKKDALAQRDELDRLEQAYAGLPAAKKTLETNPEEPAANLAVGKYLLEKGDWEGALSYLALSGDPQYRDLATKELTQPKELAERLAVADGWWALSEADQTPVKERFKEHAAELYRGLQAEATGLTKAKLESRVASLEASASPLFLKSVNSVGGVTDPLVLKKWKVLFHSANPAIWNTDTNKAATNFSVKITNAPENTEWLKIAIPGQKDKLAIIPMKKAKLMEKNDDEKYCWNGKDNAMWSAYHLGIVNKEWRTGKLGTIDMTGEPANSLRGWGFGNKFGVNTGQGFTWNGEEVPETAFEISVKAEDLTEAEKKFLLK